mgnify:CR=1 FL=1
MLRYKVLVLDHDDTVVRSTPEIHYPAFVLNMKIIRPSLYITCDDFFRACFDPGFYAYCRGIFHFTDVDNLLFFNKMTMRGMKI